MAYPRSLAEFKRLKRLVFKSEAERLLYNVMGPVWWRLHGWRREYRVATSSTPFYVDFACPKLMLAIEADGDQWHMNVIRDAERDEFLRDRGWVVKHFRYQNIKKDPAKVRDDIVAMWDEYNDRRRLQIVQLYNKNRKLNLHK
jgi:very-short-patch-repair endonuclease